MQMRGVGMITALAVLLVAGSVENRRWKSRREVPV